MFNSKFVFPVVVFLATVVAPSSFGAQGTSDSATKLIAVIQSDATQKEKADACRELARVGGKEAVAPLAAMLTDEKMSHMARYAMETIPDSSVDSAFRSALPKLKGRLLAGVIGSIGVRADAKAVPALTQYLTDPDADVAQAAARALGRIGNAAAGKALQKAVPLATSGNQLAFCEGLLRCADKLAANGQRRQALAMYDQLRGMTGPHQVRTAAWRGAILNRQKDGLPLLLQMVRADDFGLCDAAVRIAQEMSGSEVVKALCIELPTLPADKQILVIQTLALKRDTAALPALTMAAKTCAKPVRIAAIRALPQIGSGSSAAPLSDLMNDTDNDIAQAAQESLAALPGSEADAAVMALIASPQIAKKQAGMELAGRRRMSSALPALYKETTNSDERVRGMAIRKIGELSSVGDLPAVMELLSKAQTPGDLEASEQALSTVCLKATDPDPVVARLKTAVSQAQPAQRGALLRVLAAIGSPSALNVVRLCVADSAPEVRSAAIRSLGSWNNPEAAPDLLEIARKSTDSTERMIALRGYLRFAGSTDIPQDKRLAMCREAAGIVQKADEKKLLLSALSGIPSVDSLAMIQPSLEDDALRLEAANGVVAVADKLLGGDLSAEVAGKLIEPLEKAAKVDNENLSKRADELLGKAKAKAGGK